MNFAFNLLILRCSGLQSADYKYYSKVMIYIGNSFDYIMVFYLPIDGFFFITDKNFKGLGNKMCK